MAFDWWAWTVMIQGCLRRRFLKSQLADQPRSLHCNVAFCFVVGVNLLNAQLLRLSIQIHWCTMVASSSITTSARTILLCMHQGSSRNLHDATVARRVWSFALAGKLELGLHRHCCQFLIRYLVRCRALSLHQEWRSRVLKELSSLEDFSIFTSLHLALLATAILPSFRILHLDGSWFRNQELVLISITHSAQYDLTAMVSFIPSSTLETRLWRSKIGCA
mmetsp:Transcript_43678/g.120832  ORF Transcript_43678/g.120832 Transcript_43678/m.120832 type:complete len:220 (+) Transcript_43678:1979-2638(+)